MDCNITFFEGYVDLIAKDKISGWARNEKFITPLEVILYINNREVSHTLANKFRRDLLTSGVHPNGKCGFEFNIEGVADLKATDVVQVRAAGDLDFLPHISGANQITDP